MLHKNEMVDVPSLQKENEELKEKLEEQKEQIEELKFYIRSCWHEEELNNYSNYVTNTSSKFRELVNRLRKWEAAE